jgi:hypothetical protein
MSGNSFIGDDGKKDLLSDSQRFLAQAVKFLG